MTNVAKYSIEKDWKEFDINLDVANASVKSLAGENFSGISAYGDSARGPGKVTFWFVDEPEESVKEAVEAWWEGLSEASEEAKAYVPGAELAKREIDRKNAIEALKQSAAGKDDWADMTPAERKAVMGAKISDTDLNLAAIWAARVAQEEADEEARLDAEREAAAQAEAAAQEEADQGSF